MRPEFSEQNSRHRETIKQIQKDSARQRQKCTADSEKQNPAEEENLSVEMKGSSAMQNNHEDDEVEIDLGELFLELVRHIGKILLSTILVAVIAFAGTAFLVTPQYTSTSILYVLSSSTSITSVADIQIGSYLTTDYSEVITGRPVLDQVIENLDLDMEYSELSEKISIENPEDSRLLEITVEDPDPETAKLIADEVAEVAADYISEKMDQDPPSIIQYGYVSEDPSSPNVARNTAVGAVIGAVLAVVVVCIMYLMNDTIQSPEDMEKRVGLKVLGSLPLEGGSEYGGPAKRRRASKKKKNS